MTENKNARRERRGSILNRAKITSLEGNKIYKGEIVLTKVDIEDRKGKNGPIPKNIYCTFTQVDPETRQRMAEVEVSFWKLNAGAKNKRGENMFFPSLRENLKQMVGILACYMPYEEAASVMDAAFESFEFSDDIEEVENYKWKTKTAAKLTAGIKDVFSETLEPFMGLGGKLLNMKLIADENGDRADMPRYGIFTEAFDSKEEPTLKFSKSELANMKVGNVDDDDDE